MIARSTDVLLAQIRAHLAAAGGKEHAITLQALADAVGASKRDVEEVIEHRLTEFPWPLVAGSSGVYIPTDAGDINRYLRSLHTRHRRMQIREATVRRKARAAGWPEEEGHFVNPPEVVQQELFG